MTGGEKLLMSIGGSAIYFLSMLQNIWVLVPTAGELTVLVECDF